MKTKQELTCIGCPKGCLVAVEMDNGQIVDITGQSCPRGKDYAEKEVTNPQRMVTSTVPVYGGNLTVVPVRTASDIPKSKVFDSMAQIRAARVNAPVAAGDIIIHDLAGTGIDLIATRTVAKIMNI
ncbi:MAG: DUF1667 domain-containing protein [Clostridia bacterium]|nr:DUF1667 domain-containing protein [Clostridia bacterium]